MVHNEILKLLAELEARDIRYAIYAGTEVALLCSNRISTDLDILVHNDDLEKFAVLVPQAIRRTGGEKLVVTSDGERITSIADTLEFSIQGTPLDVMANAVFRTADGEIHEAYLTEEATEHRIRHTLQQQEVWLANPVDTLLIKAFMSRGAEQNKFDYEDCQELARVCEIDSSYLETRLREMSAPSQVRDFTLQLGL